MRTLQRRAAVAVTSVALLFAAAGSSVAAVRATRHEAGVAPSGVALPAPTATGVGAATIPVFGADIPIGAGPGLPPATFEPTAGPAPGGPITSAGPPSKAGSQPALAPGSITIGRQPTGSGALTMRSATVAINGPGGGPTPTTTPRLSPPPTVSCPSDAGQGAVPPGTGELRAVDYTLPWPGLGPLVLVPQASASRVTGGKLKIAWSSVGRLDVSGSSLTLTSPLAISYTLAAGNETARGSIHFTAISATATLDRQACPDRSFALYDVARASLDESPLRIVGFVAPTGTVTIDADGGTAHFNGPTGAHRVTLLTANDEGVAGPVVTATITVR